MNIERRLRVTLAKRAWYLLWFGWRSVSFDISKVCTEEQMLREIADIQASVPADSWSRKTRFEVLP